jgi:hypothetical protein
MGSAKDLEASFWLHFFIVVIKQGFVLPALHFLSFEFLNDFEFLTLEILNLLKVISLAVGKYLAGFVKLAQSALGQDELLLGLKVFDLNIDVIRVNRQSQVGRKGPWSGSPGYHTHIRIADQREGNDNRRIRNILVILLSFEVGQNSHTSVGIRHDFASSVNQILVEDLSEDPPNGLHETLVHGPVGILDVNPSSKSLDNALPLSRILKHNRPAFLIVNVNSKIENLLSIFDIKLLINLKLNWESVTIPAEPLGNMIPIHRSIPNNYIFYCTSSNVTIMGQTCGKRRTIIESVKGFILSVFQL